MALLTWYQPRATVLRTRAILSDEENALSLGAAFNGFSAVVVVVLLLSQLPFCGCFSHKTLRKRRSASILDTVFLAGSALFVVALVAWPLACVTGVSSDGVVFADDDVTSPRDGGAITFCRTSMTASFCSVTTVENRSGAEAVIKCDDDADEVLADVGLAGDVCGGGDVAIIAGKSGSPCCI